MRDDDSIMLGRTDATLNLGELYYLSHPVESELTYYLVHQVLCLNDRFNAQFQWSRACSWFIGDLKTMDTLKRAIDCGDWYKRVGRYKLCNDVQPEMLAEDVYQHLSKLDTSFILISGFNKIRFKPSQAKDEIDTLLDNLRKLQNEFNTTILLSGTTHVKYGDLNRCIPDFNSREEVEIATTASTEIATKVGSFRLFHLPNDTSTPVIKYSDKF